MMQRLPELTQGLLGLMQAKKGLRRANVRQRGADVVQIGQMLGLQEQFCAEELPEGFSGVSASRFFSNCEV